MIVSKQLSTNCFTDGLVYLIDGQQSLIPVKKPCLQQSAALQTVQYVTKTVVHDIRTI